ncbi:hypothetical protein HYZ06_02550 [Candidatus Daviesbacteria bacterium]|nr:hypothetical protein [Candidatus Daviesbacteria bacterium]
MDKLSATPNVYTSPPPGGGKKQFSIRKFISPKTIFLSLGAVLLIEVIFAIKTLTAPTPPPPTAQSESQPSSVNLSLEAVGQDFKVGEVITVNVRVNTGGHQTDGIDLLLNFDPKILEASAASLIKTTIYPDYPQMRVDAKAGLIQISGISGLDGKTFKGAGVFATINFKARAAGDTTLTINFTPGKTDDSNIVESLSGNDILESVFNLNLSVQ